MMPQVDGYQFLKQVREDPFQDPASGVLTAKA